MSALKERLWGLLKEHEPKLTAVATATANGRPAAAVMGYAVRDDGTVVVSTHQSSHKWGNLQANPEIALVVGWDYAHPHIQFGGDARLVSGDDAREVEEFFFAANPRAKAFKAPDTGYVVITPTWTRITEFQASGPPKTQEGDL